MMEVRALVLMLLSALSSFGQPNYDRLAARIVDALKLRAGERVLARFDPAYFSEILAPLERRVKAAKATWLPPPAAADPLGDRLLESADVFIWLPLGSSARQLTASEQVSLVRWVDKGGTRRELHFHWSEGTRLGDGLPAPHPPEFDALYEGALDIDYAALDAAQERAIEVLRQGTVRVLTPAGTDLVFRIGLRPFNKQNGDASPERARSARVRVDRHIELPAGVLRVAPVEESAAGNIVIPEARFGGTVARRVVLQIDNGRVTRVRAEQGQEAVEAALAAGGEAAHRFREFALGFNPKLTGGPPVPYYGYGAGAVRLSLGDNEELGGAVRGGFSRWFFFTDATVHVDFRYLVRDGKLVP